MMLHVFGYAIAVAAVLSVVGLCAERFARLHGLPRRTAWVAAMLMSVLLPVAMILLGRPAEIRNVSVTVADQDVPYINPEPAYFAESPAAQLPEHALPSVESVRSVPASPSTSVAPRSTWKLPRPSDRLLITTWMATSSVLALYLLGANLLLRRRMKGWHNATVQDHQVLISEVTGPALLGALSPRIVVPRWLLMQPHGTQALILQHEQQHVLARDALLIMAGLVAIVAVPWNLPLWWQWRRMRQAIEMDCDARVLGAGVEANAYAQVLLEVARHSTRSPAGALAMSEPVHALERRIANLVPDAIRYAMLQTTAVVLLAAVGAGAALAMEAPAWPGRAAAAPVAAPKVVRTPASFGMSASPAAVITAAQSTIIAAAAPASRADEPAPAVQTQVLAHLATEPASFMVRILSPVAEPSLLSIRMARVTGAPSTSGDADAAARARLEEYYAILVEKLTAVPGLRLITEATPGVPGVPYEISISLGAGWKGVVIEAISVRSPSRPKVQTTTRDASQFVNQLSAEARDLIPVDDPERDMERFVERMRLELFPPDRALLDQKMSELRDPRLQPGMRAQALRNLMTVDSLYDSFGARMDSFAGRVSTYRPDPALLGAATELAMTDKDPEVRRWLWNTLVADPFVPVAPAALVMPAGRALAGETDLHVQLMLVNILSRSAANPQARAALESAASRRADVDHPELVRMAARRVLDDGTGWNDYFFGRLKDPQVPDAERVELLNYTLSLSSSGHLMVRSGVRMKLDEAAERSLGSLLKSPASTQVVAAAARLLGDRLLPRSAENRGSPVAYEELLDFLRAGTGKPEADPQVRSSVLTQLLFDLRSHPEARPVFEDIVVRDRDPVLRERARQALERK
jgi:beta-lactamase regulating signal transducer with metallopeptidase domain